MTASNDGDSIGEDVRVKSITGTTDIGFGESWQLRWGEWNPPGVARLFITNATLTLESGTFDAFGYEVGEPPESLPCSLADLGNYRIITVVNTVGGTPQPIVNNIYKMYFVFPSSAHNTYINASVCLARNDVEGDPHELQTANVHVRFH
ncbi:MAG: hypothetical protein M9899_05605 [Bdellovibrionaceae bacterium]|nr:hypothetical protein [Pseudobdellovibrionaceae bacterium]